ncbi:MAG: aconitase X catalytic domain-containing protein [Candidatus Aenigmatarchaeota archaeon]
MELTKEEREMFVGERGEGIQKAMEIIVALGKIYSAERLIRVTSVQVAGVSYKNLGDAGIEFLEDWARKGAKISVRTTLNPAGMDLENWKRLGFKEEFAKKQLKVIEAFKKIGISPVCTCTPYLIGNLPKFGEHIAWSESSAVSFANSVIGARTNREGGPSALAAAITGRTACYGFHLKENRKADFVFDVKCKVDGFSDLGALGNIIGKSVKNKVPYIIGVKEENQDNLKVLGASMAASGAVALYHIDNVTPEAKIRDMRKEEFQTIVIESLEEGYKSLNSNENEIDFVSIGCPHASVDEIKKISELVIGKKLKAELWVTTSKHVKKLADKYVRTIEQSGGKVLSDTCMIVAPVEDFGFKNLATNSGKAAFYAPSYSKLNVRFGSLEQCINAALTGRWE